MTSRWDDTSTWNFDNVQWRWLRLRLQRWLARRYFCRPLLELRELSDSLVAQATRLRFKAEVRAMRNLQKRAGR